MRPVLAAAFLAAASLEPGLRAARADTPPNVLLVMTDDQGWGDAGYRGHAELHTPHLDALAASGLRLERFYAAAPVCSPTRASVLTGRHPARMLVDGANSGHLPAEEHTLAELLRARGYATGFFGKWHLGTLTRDEKDSNRGGRAKHDAHYTPPSRHGFDTVFATEAKVPTWDPMRDPETGEPYGTAYWNERGERVLENLAGDDSRVIVDRVVPFLRGAVAAGRPFLAVVWLHAPHEPVVAPGRPSRHPAVEDDAARRYYDCLADVDEQIGRLVRTLEELDARANTLVWFASDNGPEHRTGPGSTGGLRGRKRSLYEGGVRVPGILSWPASIAPGGATDEPLSTLDVLPTVADVTGLALDPGRPLDGRSFFPSAAEVVEGRPARHLFFRAGKCRAVHLGAAKLVVTDDGSRELYDLAADPRETVDLAADRPETVAELDRALARWDASVARSRRGMDDPVLEELDESAPRPHVLLLMADDLGKEWIGCTGGEGVDTPHLDALAASGTRFTRAWSQPKCTPSRVTLLTGQHPFRHGWVDHWDVPRWGEAWFDPSEYRTLPEVLRAAGYRNVAAGKWQINDFRLTPLAAHRFDSWLMWTGYEAGVPESANRYEDPYLNGVLGSRAHPGAFGPDLFVEYLLTQLEREAANGPMFLYYPMVLPHGPLTATPLEPEAAGADAKWAAMVRHVDHIVGRLVAGLEDAGLRDETLVIFTTDNGSDRGRTGRIDGREVRGGKGALSRAGIAAPLFVSWPGHVPAGRVCDAPTDFTDLLPTLADVAGARLAEHVVVDGISQWPQWRGDAAAPRREWVLAMGGGKARLTEDGVVPAKAYADRALGDGRWKLVVAEGAPTRLFDLDADPFEEHDLYASEEPAAREARARLEAALADLPARDAAPRYVPR